jgi:hypothetical protein
VEECEQERTSARQATARETEHAGQGGVIFRAEVGDNRSLEPGPGSLHWVEFGGVSRQANQCQPPLLALDEGAGNEAPMRIDAVPDHDEGTGVMLVEPLKEADDVLRADGSWHEAEEEAGSVPTRGVGQRPDPREVLPGSEAGSQDRGLPARRPGALDRRSFRESALVDEDDRGPLARGVFFTAGHVVLTQRSIAASSRSRARVVGFCRDQPRLRRIRHTWPGW